MKRKASKSSKIPPSKRKAAQRASDGTCAQPTRSQATSRESDSDSDSDIQIISAPERKSASTSAKEDDGSASDSGKKSLEEQLEDFKKSMRSPAYAFFHVGLPKVETERPYFVFSCRSCDRKINRYMDTKDSKSTGNLLKHARECYGQGVVGRIMEARTLKDARAATRSFLEDGKITAVFERRDQGKVTYSHQQHTHAETRIEIVRWVSESLRPLNIVNDRGFRSLMLTGRPGYRLPSPATVSRDVKEVFSRTRKRIGKFLREHRGRLNFATDAWTSPNHRAFVAISVHLEIKGKPSHSGVNLAAAFAQVMHDFGIEDKMLAVTCDNASSNDTMVNALAIDIPSFGGQRTRTRCVDHVVCLVAKSVTRQFDGVSKNSRKEGGNSLALDLEEEERTARMEMYKQQGGEGDDDDDGLIDALELMSEEERETFLENIEPVRLVLVKLRKVAFKIIHSTTLLLPAWRRIVAELKLPDKLIPRDYRKAFDILCADKANKLRQYELSEGEWTIAIQLRKVLRVRLCKPYMTAVAHALIIVFSLYSERCSQLFKDATLKFSREEPNLAAVIPAMEHMQNMLSSYIADQDNFEPSIRVALSLAKTTLSKYYNLTDSADIYRIAMVLHPRYKTAYFKKLNWTRAWIDGARRLVRAEFDRVYAHQDDSDDSESDDGFNGSQTRSADSDSDSDSSGSSQSSKNKTRDADAPESDSGNIFDQIPDLFCGSKRRTSEVDELDAYLKAEPEDITNPFQWWYRRRRVYPRLARMAMDYLSIPATSVDVERVFSRGRLLLPHVRNRLSAQTTRALLCLGDWSVHGYIAQSDLADVAKMPEVDDSVYDDEQSGVWDVIELVMPLQDVGLYWHSSTELGDLIYTAYPRVTHTRANPIRTRGLKTRNGLRVDGSGNRAGRNSFLHDSPRTVNVISQMQWLPRRPPSHKTHSSMVLFLENAEDANLAIENGIAINGRLLRTERFRSFPTQCFNCHRFGHIARYCRGRSTCGLCAGPHTTTSCRCPSENACADMPQCNHTPPKCALCKGPHGATSRDCPVRADVFARCRLGHEQFGAFYYAMPDL
ncbi:hypothetical protein NUW54_g5941 [Trametes sanguinea]|uniref:Uncharacterized protein n=1 Tax=Trametes sanguinea TaxID=158606 RepID=A0ACC1PVS6_9APHY|nr:hypothetical protein NUW54_g5941 [Trametes sanguinea]